MNFQIIDYINQHLANGYTLKKIRDVLLRSYDAGEVNECLSYVIQNHIKTIKPYALSLLSQGKTIDEIKQISLSQEHDELIIEQLISELSFQQPNNLNDNVVNNPNPNLINNKKSLTFSKNISPKIVFIFIFIMFILGFLLSFFVLNKPDTTMNISSVSKLSSNSNFEFTINFENLYNSKDDIIYTYFLEDPLGKLKSVRSERKSPQSSFKTYISISELDVNGNYLLRVEAKIGNNLIKSSSVVNYGASSGVNSNSETNTKTDNSEVVSNNVGDDKINSNSQNQSTSSSSLNSDDSSLVQKDNFNSNVDNVATSSSSTQSQLSSSGAKLNELSFEDRLILTENIGLYYQKYTELNIDEKYELASSNSDALTSFCNKLPFNGNRQSCLSTIKNEDVTCNNSVVYFGKTYCIYDDANLTQNGTIDVDCSLVIEPDKKLECEKYLELSKTNSYDVVRENYPGVIGDDYSTPKYTDDYLGYYENNSP